MHVHCTRNNLDSNSDKLVKNIYFQEKDTNYVYFQNLLQGIGKKLRIKGFPTTNIK